MNQRRNLPAMQAHGSAPNLEQALREAWNRRQPLHDDPDIDVYRIFHGFTEGRVGLEIEKFGPVVRVVWKSEQDLETNVVCRTLLELGDFETIAVRRVHRETGTTPVELFDADGTPVAPNTESHEAETDVEIQVREFGLRFQVRPFADGNSGLFLDARPARQWIREHSRQSRVLNLFAYTGSLGVAAAAGGAAAVTHVDGKRNALERTRANHELNELPIDDRSLLRGNIYTHLPKAVRHGQRFDAVILDPPPQLPRVRGHKPKGQDYATLARYATQLLEDEGWMLSFFSRYGQGRDEYEAQVAAASDGKLQPFWRGTSGDDFPEETLRLTAWIKR
ncbi:MAG: hypothetical protein HOM68_24510 [Gemmatimonadetes bacterium]|nr:hypothetical protein [Gemmatimonadota bacterium]MBT5144757.1 hypothetical protein [Gemmatimonadota bacterium]MBT5962556.1 hypothetical protein [Gemmatimonadota bacterium]MBT6626106.1 hypothetical protein [Gemmatimonadota bacterium]MBT7594807.1 hypothetical protein [Gemmatimonadota bacterium]